MEENKIMIEHLLKNWIVYILLGGFIWFVVAVYINSQKQINGKREESQKNKK